MSQAGKESTDVRIRNLAGNQARIALLWLSAWHVQGTDKYPYLSMVNTAIDIAESYNPESDLKSF